MCDNLLKRICDVCRENPERVAIVDSNEHITYHELIIRVQKVYSFLKKKTKKGDLVGVCMERTVSYVIAMLAILMSGCIYMPIDKENIGMRFDFIVRKSKCLFVITDLEGEISHESKVYQFHNIVRCHEEIIALNCDVNQNQEAYIFFTSGSTGNPKGAIITYGNLYNLLKGLDNRVYSNYRGELNIAVVASFSFDASIKQVFYSLLYGHTLYIVPEETKKFGRLLCKYLTRNRIDICDCTPTLIDAMGKDKRTGSYYGLKKILVGGESMFGRHINCIRSIFGPKTTIVNLYGPTECCVDVCYHIVEPSMSYKAEESIPVGTPLDNNEIILNMENEIVIMGENVGKGYLIENGKSGFCFNHGKWSYNTGDIGYYNDKNELVVVGRCDRQVKVNGYRIELAGIEKNIYKIHCVRFARVFVKNRKIVAVISSENTVKEYYIEHLKRQLPHYMLPNIVLFDDDIAMNKNLKFNEDSYL